MKKFLHFLSLFIFLGYLANGQLPDLPSSATSYQSTTLPAGSYVIGMDNTTQANGSIFNLKAYGLVVHLLNNNVRVRWVIKPAKVKGDIDFSVSAQRMITSASITTTSFNRNINISSGSTVGTLVSGTGTLEVGMKVSGQNAIPPNAHLLAFTGSANGNTFTLSNAATGNLSNKSVEFSITKVNSTSVSFAAAANYDFRAGPFVIFQEDTSGVAALVAGFNEINTTSTTRVNVYKTTAPVAGVDVRYDYLISGVIWKPKAAILNDGGKADIHEKYMNNAGISSSNGFINWTRETTPGFVTQCYTFATEPHNDSSPDSVIQGIRTFVENGGNFLAQCAAVRTYELSPLARFQSTNGFDNANENKIPATTLNDNAYLSYTQIDGLFNIGYEGGSLQSWRVPSVANGNPPVNNFHYHTNGTAIVSGTNSDTYTNASVSKVLPSGNLGGMVFYLGSHDWAKGTTVHHLNGQRLFMNALLTPTNPQGSLNLSGFIQCGNNQNPVQAQVGVNSAPVNAYPISFKLFRESNGIPGLQQNGPTPDTQEGSTVIISAPPAVQTGTITGSIMPPNANSTYYLVKTPASGCLQETVDESQCSSLPVSFTYFNAVRNGRDVNLTWQTATEENNDGFEIQRLIGTSGWQKIGYVNSLAVTGNSSTLLNYQQTDFNNTIRGISQYRLKQIDKDGKFAYSVIRSVRGDGQKGKTIVYPNPSNDGKVNVVFEDVNVIRDISLIDLNGRIIQKWNRISNNNIQIDNLVPGFYTVRIVNTETGEQDVEKIIVNKR